MTELIITSSSITEPVTTSEMKTYLGYPTADTSQDTLIAEMITAARIWLENRTALSVVSKNYTAQFEKSDKDSEGWYTLPVSPVTTADNAYVVSVSGTSTTYQVKGLRVKKIKPDNVVGTIRVGADSEVFYLTVSFTAGAANETAEIIIRRLVAAMFSKRGGSKEVSASLLDYDTLRMIESISMNI
jgi:uncharacterized phiE125 gp8 family phage protein